ncbi:hypothetical protein D3C71_1746000 [compost metagenome]
MSKIYLKKQQQVQSAGGANAALSHITSEGRVDWIDAGIPVLGDRISATEAGDAVLISAAIALNRQTAATENIPVWAAGISSYTKFAMAIVTHLGL